MFIKPRISSNFYDSNLDRAWQKSVEDVLLLCQKKFRMILVVGNPLESLEEELANAKLVKFDEASYSIVDLTPGNVKDEELIKNVTESIEFQCAYAWFIVSDQTTKNKDFLNHILEGIKKSNNFLSLSSIDFQMLALVADGNELMWLNKADDAEISLDKVVETLKSNRFYTLINKK